MRCYSVSGLLSFLKENFDNIKFYETSSKRKKSEEFLRGVTVSRHLHRPVYFLPFLREKDQFSLQKRAFAR